MKSTHTAPHDAAARPPRRPPAGFVLGAAAVLSAMAAGWVLGRDRPPPVTLAAALLILPTAAWAFWIVRRKQRDRRLWAQQEEEAALREAMLEHTDDALLLADADTGRILRANPRASVLLGLPHEPDDAGRFDHLLPEHTAALQRSLERVRHGESDRLTAQMRKPDQPVRDIELLCVPVRRAGRRMLCATIRDIGDRVHAETSARADMQRMKEESTQSRRALLSVVEDQKRAEEARDQDRALLRTVIDNLPDAVCMKDDKLRIRLVNRAQMERFGATADTEVLGKTDADFHDPDEAARVMDGDHDVLRVGRPVLNREDAIRHPGGVRVYLVSRLPLIGAQGEVTGLVSISRDITDLKNLEDQFRQSQKMESIGRLAGGIAHDFNNMLQTIFGNTELALAEADPDSTLYEDLTEIRSAARRSSELTSKLLAFARRQSIAPVAINLNDAIGDTLQMLGRMIGEDIQLSWRPGADLWQVTMDPSQLDQVLTNLSVNARDAVSGTGRLTIETENLRITDEFCAAHIDATPGDWVRLTFSDNGCGMTREVQAHLFEPFFTTKEKGKGTGLGLATIYGIVRQNGGFIHVYSEPGYGTTFRIYLPRSVETDDAQTQEPDETPTGGQETLLVVEDEATILRLAQRVLQQYGYTILAASSPAEALELLDAYPNRVDLLLTDVIMPGMNGRELAERVVRARPGIRVIYMSGYTANVISKEGLLARHIHFLPKPFSSRALAGKVRRVLDLDPDPGDENPC